MQQPTRAIGPTAEQMMAKTDNKIADTIVFDHIKLIDDVIMSAIVNNHCSIAYELPTTFNLTNMPKQDAQTYIYSQLLLMYTTPIPHGKGYQDVSITLGNKPTLYIKWKSGLDNDEKTRRQNYIKTFMK